MKYSRVFLFAISVLAIFMFLPLPPVRSHAHGMITFINLCLYQILFAGMFLGTVSVIIFGIQCAVNQKISLWKILLWIALVLSVAAVSIGWQYVKFRTSSIGWFQPKPGEIGSPNGKSYDIWCFGLSEIERVYYCRLIEADFVKRRWRVVYKGHYDHNLLKISKVGQPEGGLGKAIKE